MNCGAINKTVVLAHYSGFRQHAFGKGRGCKGDDGAAAPQCGVCHDNGPFAEGHVVPGFADQSLAIRKAVKSEEQLYQIVMWHIRVQDE